MLGLWAMGIPWEALMEAPGGVPCLHSVPGNVLHPGPMGQCRACLQVQNLTGDMWVIPSFCRSPGTKDKWPPHQSIPPGTASGPHGAVSMHNRSRGVCAPLGTQLGLSKRVLAGVSAGVLLPAPLPHLKLVPALLQLGGLRAGKLQGGAVCV